jgi:DNA anti-recombination protein RmuC
MSWTDLGILASILGVFIALGSIAQALILGRTTTRLQADIHTATQATLADLGKGFRETQQQLGQTLERMDQGWREAFERMDQRADERHREVISAIQALKG